MGVRIAPKESSTTPPGSFIKQPLTPPPSEQKSGTSIERIIQEIKSRKSGRSFSTKPWLCYTLSPAEYEYLEQQLQTNSFVEDKLRIDYFPSKNALVLRMPSALHEAFKSSIVDEIVQQLRSIARGNSSASEFARAIKHGGSASITFEDPAYGRHEPDDLFHYLGAQFPNVIIELSYSQKRKDLVRLADDYILGSDGNIGVVIGFDIDYKDKSATLSMWRPRLEVNELGEEELVAYQAMSDQEFRRANGEVNPQAGFRLQLEDFVPSALLPKDTKLGKDIFISSAVLCAYLRDADRHESNIKQKTGLAKPLKLGVKKRRRSSSSIEQLNTDDESRFQQEEAHAAKRSHHGDGDYRVS